MQIKSTQKGVFLLVANMQAFCYIFIMNTPKKGKVRYIVFKDKDVWYATGLEFNIVESGDSPRIAMTNLFDAMEGYVEAVRKLKGVKVSPLNQETDPEYEKMWNRLEAGKQIKSPFIINTYGTTVV